MTKLRKRKLWILVLIIMLITLGISFFSQTSSVRAMLGNTHTADVLIRFINEIVLKSPAGQYYIDLTWKHTDDLNRIYIDTPDYMEHREKLIQLIQMFTPGMEAVLDGKGDTVQITKEQIDLLQTELDWATSVAGQPLRKDIEKELQRFPLDNFIGMTMSEALDYVNSTWTSETRIETLATTPITINTEICAVGFGSDCLEKPTLVPDSNGLWAYYVHQGVYFEYPSTWEIQNIEPTNYWVEILPSLDSPEGRNIIDISLTILPTMNTKQYSEYILTQPREYAKWKHPVSIYGFQGVEFLWGDSDLAAVWEISIYSESNQVAVDLQAIITGYQLMKLIDNPDTVKQIFPNIQHIIESIRMWEP